MISALICVKNRKSFTMHFINSEPFGDNLYNLWQKSFSFGFKHDNGVISIEGKKSKNDNHIEFVYGNQAKVINDFNKRIDFYTSEYEVKFVLDYRELMENDLIIFKGIERGINFENLSKYICDIHPEMVI